jgi:hypothetical protein
LPAVAWTKDTDQILAKLNSGNTTATSDHKGDIPERWPKRRSRPTSSGNQPSRYQPSSKNEAATPALGRTPDDAATPAIGGRRTSTGVTELPAYGADDEG